MQFADNALRHLSSATHQGRILVLGVDRDRAIHYRVKHEPPQEKVTGYTLTATGLARVKRSLGDQGFDVGDRLDSLLDRLFSDESNFLTAVAAKLGDADTNRYRSDLVKHARHVALIVWTEWKLLPLPQEAADPSVIERERAEETDGLVASIYRSFKDGAYAPVQAVSDGDHLYIFRQSQRGTLLVDRFVLDQEANALVRTIEVRYRRSRQRHRPQRRAGASQELDSRDFRDMDGTFFLEPSLELRLIDRVEGGRFAVALTPTHEPGTSRWHIFAWDAAARRLRLVTLRKSPEAIFDLDDWTVVEGDAEAPTPRQVPAIIRRAIKICDHQGATLEAQGGIAATVHDLQREVDGDDGERHLVKLERRVLVTVPAGADAAIAALSFAVHRDGALALLDPAHQETRRTERLAEVERSPGVLARLESWHGEAREAPPPPPRTGIVFDGATQRIETRTRPSLVETSFTVELWARRRAAGRCDLAFGQGVAAPGRGLHLGCCGDVFRFSFHHDDVLDTPPYPDFDWHHWACVYELGGTRRIYRDGVKVAEDRPSGPYLGEGELTIGTAPWNYPFAGELSDVRLWRRARSQAEIAASMGGRLSGRELGLIGHWPLDAIVDGTVFNTVAPATPGVVVGGAYRGGRALARHLADGVRAVDRYRDPALAPVVERRTYVESFELRADGELGGFDLAFWGETARGELTAPVRVPALLERLADGWTRASARFTAPVGLVRLRSLELTAPSGAWSRLEVRNLRLQEIRSVLTEVTHEEVAALTALAPEHAELVRIESAIEGLERREGELAGRLRALEQALARSHDDLRAEVTRARGAVEDARQRVQASEADLSLHQGNVTYRSAVALRTFNPHYQRYVCVDGQRVVANREQASVWETFTIEWVANPTADHVVHYGDWVALRAHTGKYLLADNPTSGTSYYWVRAVYPAINAYERFRVLNPGDLTYRGPVPRDGLMVFQTWRSDYGSKYMICGTDHLWRHDVWCEHELFHDDGRFAVSVRAEGPWSARVHAELNAARQELARRQRELKTAEQLLQDATDDRDRVQRERDEAEAALLAHQARIAAEAGTHLAATRALEAADLAMPRLTAPDRPLSVAGALLGFATTRADVAAYESAEGAVHLHFAGTEGRLRRAVLDGVTQRWQVDTLASCLRLRGASAVEIPHTSAFSVEVFTLEMWVRWSGDGDAIQFLAAKGHEEMELHTGGAVPGGVRFIPAAGVFVDTPAGALPRGEWVHVAGVYQGLPGTAEIYLNGVLTVAARQDLKKERRPTSSPLVLGRRGDGNFRFSGDMAEVRLWRVALSAEEIASQMHHRLSGHEPGLAGYWPLREGEGAVARDGSSTRRDGTITAPAWIPSTAPLGRPSSGSRQVLDFQRAGAVSIPHRPAYVTSTFTLELRFRWTGSGRDLDFLFSKGQEEMELHTGGAVDNGLRFIPVRGVYIDTAAGAIRPGVWTHVACVYTGDPATSRIHVDGVAVATQVTSSGAPHAASTAPLVIGNRGSGGYGFAGQIVDVRLWSSALSPAEVAARAHQPPAGDEPALLGAWPLEDLAARDRSRHSNHGSVDGPRFVRGFFDAPAVLAGEYGSVDAGDGAPQALLRRVVAWPTLAGNVEARAGARVDGLELRWLGNAQMKPTLAGYIEGAPPVPSENLTVQEDYNGASSVEFKVAEEATTTIVNSETLAARGSAQGGLGFFLSGNAGVSFLANKEFAYTFSAMLRANLAFGASRTDESARSSTTTVTTSEALALKGSREEEARFPGLGRRFVPKNVGYATVISTLADVFVLRARGSKRMIGYQVTPVQGAPPDVNVVTFMINPAYTLNGSLDGQVGSRPADERHYGHVPDARSSAGARVAASYYRLDEAYALRDAIARRSRRAEALAINDQTDLLDGLAADVGGPAQSEEEVKARASAGAQETTERAKAEMQRLSPQERLEKVIEETPKGDIVNTYVWDGDGGLRTQAQTFATAWQTVIGQTIDLEVGYGISYLSQFPFFTAELSLMATYNYTKTKTTTHAGSRAIELNVTLNCENQGITDNQDRPLVPGEKVDRYRFMSFALQPATEHFHDFFDRVVDPEWLASDDEEARVLRRLDRRAPNRTWRVLHRVTYVERPTRSGGA